MSGISLGGDEEPWQFIMVETTDWSRMQWLRRRFESYRRLKSKTPSEVADRKIATTATSRFGLPTPTRDFLSADCGVYGHWGSYC